MLTTADNGRLFNVLESALTERDPACPTVPHDRPEGECCAPTVALVAASKRVARCPHCDAEYFPVFARDFVPGAPLSSRPGLDLREGEVPPPRARPARARQEPESAEVALARRLLVELRPESGGPLGWGPYELPPNETVKPTPPVRVQNGQSECDVPRGAFVRPRESPLTEVRRRLDRVASDDPQLGAALVHLQRHGTLLHGFAPLCVGLAHAIADTARLASWHADESRAWDRAKVWGAGRLEAAAAAWDRTLDVRSSA